MLTSSVSLKERDVKQFEKLMKIVNLKHLSNLNEFFRKGVSYNKTKSYKKKARFHALYEIFNFEKLQEIQIDPRI